MDPWIMAAQCQQADDDLYFLPWNEDVRNHIAISVQGTRNRITPHTDWVANRYQRPQSEERELKQIYLIFLFFKLFNYSLWNPGVYIYIIYITTTYEGYYRLFELLKNEMNETLLIY